MEKLKFNYSLKNIPIPPNESYKLKLVEKMELVVKRMRWKAHFFLEEQKKKNNNTERTNEERQSEKEKYGFKSKSCPKPLKELEHFENDLFNMIKTLKFRRTKDRFQSQLKEDIRKISKSTNVLVFADKTSNIYELKPDEHRKLLSNNITRKHLKKSNKL